jgi:hypothetical protein
MVKYKKGLLFMANEDRSSKSKKEGVSVEEMQSFFNNFGPEISLCLIFVLSAISAIFLFQMENWCILLLGLGGVVGVLMPKAVRQILGTIMRFSATTGGKYGSMAIAIVAIVISLIAAPLTFLVFGLSAGEMLVRARKEH